MNTQQIKARLAVVTEEQDFDALVKEIEANYRVTSADISSDGHGAKWYGGDEFTVTYQANFAFNVSFFDPLHVSVYRPNW
jgi:hypothetical protein